MAFSMGLKTITSETDRMRGLVKKAVLLEKHRRFLLSLKKIKITSPCNKNVAKWKTKTYIIHKKRKIFHVYFTIDIEYKLRPQKKRESASFNSAALASEESAILFFTQTVPIRAQDVLFLLILICTP